MIASGADLTKFNEGLTLTAKPDAKGHWEIGYGHDIPPSPGLVWTEKQAEDQFAKDYAVASYRASVDLGAPYGSLRDQRRAVLNDIAFEVGGAGLAQFHRMLAAITAGDWQEAAAALKNSLLFEQVPNRENRNIQILITGEWPT
jgi:GH24 family phage-related lysozyme (muramidase)